MVVGISSVARDFTGPCPALVSSRRFSSVVAHRQDNDRSCLRKDLVWIDSFVSVAREVGHLALMPPFEPALKVPGRLRRLGIGKSAGIEPEFASPCFNESFHCWPGANARDKIDASPAA